MSKFTLVNNLKKATESSENEIEDSTSQEEDSSSSTSSPAAPPNSLDTTPEVSKKSVLFSYLPMQPNPSLAEDLSQKMEIQKYNLKNQALAPIGKLVYHHNITYADNVTGYKILMSNFVPSNAFIIGMYAPSVHKIALAYCDRLTGVHEVKSILSKLSEDIRGSFIQVAIVSVGDSMSEKVEQVLDFIEESANINIEFHHSHANPVNQQLAVDTEGNFSTDCSGIGTDFGALQDYQILTGQMTQLYAMEVLGIEFPLFGSNY